MRLENFIRGIIKKKGSIPFSAFMAFALYHEKWGYYSVNPTSGDYYTNADVHPIFSEILARYFADYWKKNFHGEKLTLVELGPGSGKLAGNILAHLQEQEPQLYSACEYFLIEKGADRKKSCGELKKKHPGRVQVQENLPAPREAIVYSNEFFDALPFERVLKTGGNIKEIWVDENFKEVLKAPRPAIADFFKWLEAEPEEGCLAEASWPSKEWMVKIGKFLKKGLVFTIDYGFESREIFSPVRSQGTALCHLKHQTNRNFYEHIGEQDITAHVNFSVLMKEGMNWGLRAEKLMTQTRFIVENGFEDAVRKLEKTTAPKDKIRLSSAIKSLVHPEGMGGTFKVLLQMK